jgi:hypothetical protein
MNFAQSNRSSEIREKDLPYSKMVFPKAVAGRLKYGFWRVYTPLHPIVRNCALALHIVAPPAERQNFLIGRIAPGISVNEIVNFLISQGYGNHFIAWEDTGQVVSLRRVVGFERQYHVRIFEDGEIRGHYEYTPECYPILHYKAVDQEPRRDDFLQLFGDRIIPNLQ